ncbi:MAG: sortase [SAR202 cluster bacterium]|nr:sortase [SAR202 cluster bacterium]
MGPGQAKTPAVNPWKSRAVLAAMAIGVLLLAAGGGYFLYSLKAHQGLDKLNVSLPSDSVDVTNSDGLIGGRAPTPSGGDAPSASPSDAAIASFGLYPGEVLNPLLWAEPLHDEHQAYIPTPPLDGYEPVDATSLPVVGALDPPSRMLIRAISMEATVQGLKIENVGDSRAYQTPKDVVGHIPETANAGERGTAWFFGHLQSPVRDEGNVFANLPKIAGLLRKGIPVYVEVENGQASYLYRITDSKIIHQNELVIEDGGAAIISLVTCYPPIYYDERVVVSGPLVGVKARAG